MQYTDEQIEKMLQLKESIVDKMAKHQDELDFLQKNLDILDVVLKGSSFTKASSLPRKSEPIVETIAEKEDEAESGRGGAKIWGPLRLCAPPARRVAKAQRAIKSSCA